jgi:hypothetical protein
MHELEENVEDIQDKTIGIDAKVFVALDVVELLLYFLFDVLELMLLNLIEKMIFLQEMYLLEQILVDEDVHVIDNNKELLQNKHDVDQKNILLFQNSNKVFVYFHYLIKYQDIILK